MPAPDGAARDRVDRLERLLAAGRALTSELDLPTVLDRLRESACALTGARHAAVVVLGEAPRGDPPAGEVLEMPIAIRGEPWGTLRLAGKPDAAGFAADDRDAIAVLVEWAAVAIDNARLFTTSTARGQELDRALRTMRTAMEIATAVGGDTDLARILELIVGRARELVEADALLIFLLEGDQLRVAAVAGNADVPEGAAIPLDASTAGEALRARRSVRVEDAQRMLINPAEFGMPQASSTLIVPLVHRRRRLGVLVAFDHLGTTASFDDDDERALEAFAASAATAVATAWLVEKQRLHDSMAAAESERGRWARELHDETLQGLASLKLALAGALRADPARARVALEAAVAQLGYDIAALRAIIADLRPAALDELGLEPALRTLVAQVADAANLETRVSIAGGAARLRPDVETIAYRVAQEALTNVVKHAEAGTITVDVRQRGGTFRLRVADDGRGVAADGAQGYGIVGMRERAALAGGRLDIAPVAGGGTRVTLELPLG
jgi:signal transduction histidine kinase